MPKVKCPNCGNETEYQGNEFRPFCSERCKLLDFGAWADERYTLPVENSEITEADLEELERSIAGKVEE
ncbi:MAG: DNA gyrase inhibitor YacG [Pyrinomonadaceae bacterium]